MCNKQNNIVVTNMNMDLHENNVVTSDVGHEHEYGLPKNIDTHELRKRDYLANACIMLVRNLKPTIYTCLHSAHGHTQVDLKKGITWWMSQNPFGFRPLSFHVLVVELVLVAVKVRVAVEVLEELVVILVPVELEVVLVLLVSVAVDVTFASSKQLGCGLPTKCTRTKKGKTEKHCQDSDVTDVVKLMLELDTVVTVLSPVATICACGLLLWAECKSMQTEATPRQVV